jgi:hypothetical protein
MRYKAFVAATKRDLGEYRDRVIHQLNKAQIEVDPMEDWPADPTLPAALSAARTQGCHFCVALVAFQRGTIAQNDPRRRSITQLEIDAARQHQAKLLVFLLRDTPTNRATWAAKGFAVDLDTDPMLVQWRRELETEFTCEFFDADEGIESFPQVLPAVMRQVLEWERVRRRHLLRILCVILVTFVLFTLVFSVSAGIRQYLLSRFLAFHDPIAFNNSRDGSYRAVRLIDGASDMQDNTNFREEIAASKQSFKMFANTFDAFGAYERDFEAIASRGVETKIVLTDLSPENRGNWLPFHEAIGIVNPEMTAAYTNENTYAAIGRLIAKYPNVELRLSAQPILYSMWLRDDQLPEALGHWRLNYYKNRRMSDWPSFRVTNTSGPGQIVAMRSQFEWIWDNAKKTTYGKQTRSGVK